MIVSQSRSSQSGITVISVCRFEEKKYAAQSRTARVGERMNRRGLAGRRAQRPTRCRSGRWHRRDRSGTRARMRWTRGGASAGVGGRRPRAIPRGPGAEKKPGKGTRLARENPLPAGRTSRRERKPSLWMAVWCTKISSEPSSGVMKPKPFWVLNHLTCARDGEAGERSGGSGKIHRFTRQRAGAVAFTVIP